MKKILLLEDDISLNETVSEYLIEQGFEVTSAYDGESAEDFAYEKMFDLYLFDVNVPTLNGFELLKALREKGDKTPAIYITSLNAIDSLEEGYESGCDDYIRKPFALKELLIRVESILKKGYFHSSEDFIKIDEKLKFDVKNEELLIENKPTLLHAKEKKLLKLFLQNQNQIISHERIYENLWGFDETPSETSLRTYIKNIRKAAGKDRILSVKKIGYKFVS